MIKNNIQTVRGTMRQAAEKAGRNPQDIRLIVVSKTHDETAIRDAIRAGERLFGENRVQEAMRKFPSLRVEYPDLELHLIGPLQTNKVDEAVALFDVIQTLDRPRLADALAKTLQKSGRVPRLYIEVNIGHEPQKAGIVPEDLPAFLTYCRAHCGLSVEGLMCIPPQDQPPEPFFQRMKTLVDDHQLPHLSMGMSGDYAAAIRCGATEIRVGSAIFGARPAA